MKKIVLLLTASMMLLLSGCAGTEPSIPKQKLYTQVNMWYVNKSYTQVLPNLPVSAKNEKALRAQHLIESTNYQRDHLIPINSEVEIVGNDGKAIFFIYDNKLIAMQNIKRYSKITTQELFERSFKPQPVDLSGYAPDERALIMKGRVVRGMSKETVLLTRGYPPAHKTPELSSDDWQYWNGRFNSRIYHFKAGKYVDYTD
jgi:hypothetical protein